ncbi:MAG: hypothetical protein HGA80_08370 [Candidatus Omnitrophica bacterium]|nr:hypothetical protein [Candidatus Omnitrophota bacterium]
MRVYHDPDEKRPMRRPHRKYWHPRYNFYERGYHFYPYVNLTSIVEIPPEAVQFLFEGNVYYYDQWAFYQQTAEGYVAVPPPIGAIVPAISANAAQSIINGEVYYRYNDVYYKPVPQGYEVVEPQQ